MSELFVDPPMETEGTVTILDGRETPKTDFSSVVIDDNSTSIEIESSIEVPKLLAEIVKPPTPPPEPVQLSSFVCGSSSLPNLQQSLINAIKNKHQTTTSDSEEASGPCFPQSPPATIFSVAGEPVGSSCLSGSDAVAATVGAFSTGSNLPLDGESSDDPNREQPLIVFYETKNSATKPLSADNTTSTSAGPLQQKQPLTIPMPAGELAPPLPFPANSDQQQQTAHHIGAAQHQQPVGNEQSLSSNSREEQAVSGPLCGSGSNTVVRNGMAVLNEVSNMISAAKETGVRQQVVDSVLVTNCNNNNNNHNQDVSLTRFHYDQGVESNFSDSENKDGDSMQVSNRSTRNSGTGSTMEDLEGLNLNLASIKSQFEKKDKADINAKGQPAVDRSASSRSDVLRKRLERYQSVVAGEAKAESSDEEGGDDQADSSKKIEPCREIGELKAQWESGRVNNDNGFATADAESLHEKICPGLSKTKVAYEKAIKESHTKENKTSPPEDVSVGHALANSLKKKFESGEVAKEEEAERLEAVKSEKEEDLSVCQDPVIAQQAKLLFQKIDKEIAARPTAPPTTSLVRTPSDSRWSRASFGEAPKDIEVVHGSEPGYKEQVEVETAALSERYRFFENFKEEAASVKKKFQMTPPRELEPRNRDASPPPVCERDPNVVVGSITTTDIPNVDTATKMRQKFETLCQTGGLQEPPVKTCQVPKPRPLKKPSLDASPPQVTATSSAHVIEEDCMPADNITRNMRAVFERNNVADKNNGSGQLSSPASTERVNPPKVSRFVFGTPETEVCSMCQGKVFPMERREASGLVMHTKCFKCTRCNINLRLDGYSQKGGKLYCEAHYQQLFKVKGNYDEGFGCEKWSRTPSPSAHDAPPTSLNLPPAASNQTLIA